MEELFEQVVSLSDIHKIIDFISDELKKPVILESADFFLLAYNSYYINQFDAANQQTIFSKKCPLPIFEKFVEEGIIDQLKTIPTPFRVKQIEEIGLNQRVVVSAKHKDEIMGYIWVQEIENSLSEEELNFLYKASFHVGKVIFKKKQMKQEKEEEAEELYKRAINDQFQSEQELKVAAEKANVVLPAVFTVMVLQVVNGADEVLDDLKETIRSYLNLKDNISHVLEDHSNIAIIVGSISRKRSAQRAASDLINRLLTHLRSQILPLILIGVGNEYSSLLSLGKSYREALEVTKAAEMTGSQEHIPFEYQKLGLFKYLEQIAAKNDQLHYTNPDLLLLKEKDKESHTEFLRTLEIYLANNCKVKPSAEKLFIHQNTLNYRIKQILDMTSIDLNHFNTRCQLFIDLMLMKKTGYKT
ncbi:helix-turn-helix domain-containing protein [Bacillus sp. CLL-7-23]|uniref:Helix-turn-helix domain-containing protein n=1 Tax=Bacillus changyiensis TaxID=3004103 RepID=A0ABT4X2A6_9BACI|nr:helix-turn-helix domain-containing protein [Bacillus changyiensis]MDA7026435.1 helix-turn-helix domain-containing protein [Bacillus changyiensis]